MCTRSDACSTDDTWTDDGGISFDWETMEKAEAIKVKRRYRKRRKGPRVWKTGFEFVEPGFREDELNAYSGGRKIGPIDRDEIDGKPVAMHIFQHAIELREAFREQFPTVVRFVISGWRSNKEQVVLHEAYAEGKKGYNLAAVPGCSNHQDGYALDLFVGPNEDTREFKDGNVTIKWRDNDYYRWLSKHAPTDKFNFIRTVESEPWHWECRPGRVANPPFLIMPP